jgi:hypothetical protein
MIKLCAGGDFGNGSMRIQGLYVGTFPLFIRNTCPWSGLYFMGYGEGNLIYSLASRVSLESGRLFSFSRSGPWLLAFPRF